MASALPGCQLRPLERWAWIDGKLSGPDLPYSCSAPLKGTKIALSCEALPNDTKIVLGGKEHKASGTWNVDIDVADRLGAVPLKEFLAPGFELDPKTPLVITISKGTVKTELPKIKYVRLGFSDAAGKPIAFGAEPARAANPAGPTALWLGMEADAFGPGTTLRDVDWVATTGETKITDGPSCKYQDPQTGKISTAPLSVHATEAIIYDRRTARVVDRNLFKPIVSCPSQKLKQQEGVHASVSEDLIKRWLQDRRTKK